LITFAGQEVDTVRDASAQYLWQFLEEISSVATRLSPQEVFNRKTAAGRVLLLV
jgi:hypothetical protein